MISLKLKNSITKELDNIYNIKSKHNGIEMSVVIDFKFTSNSMKFFQNFMIDVNSIKSNSRDILIFSKDNDLVDDLKNKYKNIVNGFLLDYKKIKKKHYKWALNDVNLERYKSVLSRKSLLPINFDSKNNDITSSVDNIINGKVIKVYQMNNSLSAKIGDLSISKEHTNENILLFLSFIEKRGMHFKRVYLSRSMNKSFRIY